MNSLARPRRLPLFRELLVLAGELEVRLLRLRMPRLDRRLPLLGGPAQKV